MIPLLNPEQLRLRSVPTIGRKKPPRPRAGDRFLKGPIPMRWLERAAQQPGRALHVGIALWFFAGLTKSGKIRLSLSRLSRLGLDRHAGSRGLRALEAAGLVAVERHPGRAPRVTLLEVPADTSEAEGARIP